MFLLSSLFRNSFFNIYTETELSKRFLFWFLNFTKIKTLSFQILKLISLNSLSIIVLFLVMLIVLRSCYLRWVKTLNQHFWILLLVFLIEIYLINSLKVKSINIFMILSKIYPFSHLIILVWRKQSLIIR